MFMNANNLGGRRGPPPELHGEVDSLEKGNGRDTSIMSSLCDMHIASWIKQLRSDSEKVSAYGDTYVEVT